MNKEGSDGPMPTVTGPNIRRQSHLAPRPSVQYGSSSRRMSVMSRTSISGTSMGTKQMLMPVKLQNTYRMAPEQSEKFNPGAVQKVIKSVLDAYLEGEVYEPKLCCNLSQNLSDVIKSRVKELGYNRYKFIVTVTVGQNTEQGMRMASRFLWHADTDSYAEASYSKGDLFAMAAVYAVYFE